MCNSDNALKVLEIINELDSKDPKWEFLNDLSVLKEEKKIQFKKLFDFCNSINSVKEYEGRSQHETTRLKGKALEQLTRFMFKYTGGLFDVYENLGTNTNEIDLFLKFSNKGKSLERCIGNQYSKIICECKNHKKHVDVTYIGKFYTLVECSKIKIGLMVSWKGIGGEEWRDGVGLTKKIFLLKERLEDRVYILDFNRKDFEQILNGRPLIKILDEKCDELQLSVDFSKYFDKHPNQEELEAKMDSILQV